MGVHWLRGREFKIKVKSLGVCGAGVYGRRLSGLAVLFMLMQFMKVVASLA